jgi:hypothetical protein
MGIVSRFENLALSTRLKLEQDKKEWAWNKSTQVKHP